MWVPHGVASPASKPAPVWAFLSTGLQVLAEACSSVGLPTVSQLPSGIPLLRVGVPSTGYRWISAPPWSSTDCRGTACLTMVFIMSCKGRFSAPTFQAPPAPSFFTDLGVCRVVSLTSSHSSNCCLTQSFFFAFLNMLPPRSYHRRCLAWPWAAAGPS